MLFIQTGGTIDKEYEEGAKAYHFIITSPSVERTLANALPSFRHRTITVARKDSLELTDSDRQAILDVCVSAPEGHIIITHGTDTLIQTGSVLSAVKGKVIVLTGALKPERFYTSDAPFNVGTAVGAVQSLSPGVYIAMSGLVLGWDRIKKDPASGQFIAIDKDEAGELQRAGGK